MYAVHLSAAAKAAEAEALRLSALTFEGAQRPNEDDGYDHSHNEWYWKMKRLLDDPEEPIENKDWAVSEMQELVDYGVSQAWYVLGTLYRDGGILILDSALAVIRLLHSMSRIFQNNSLPKHSPAGMRTDRKLLQKIREPHEQNMVPSSELRWAVDRVTQCEKQLEELLNETGRTILTMFYLELTTGLRRGEITALLWTDLDVEARTLTVSKSAGRLKGEVRVTQPKTANSVRTICLPQETVDLLVQEHEKHPSNPYMFPSPVTGRMYGPDCIGRLHKTLLKKAGITENLPFHGLRHTFATLAIQQGVDVKTVSNILGHYSAGFTLDTYAHVTGDMRREAADRMGGFIAQAI